MRDTRARGVGVRGTERAELPWPADAPLFASGTDALAALLRWGAARRGWSRVWLPSYYCAEVPAALRAFAGLEVVAYPDHDLWAPPNPVAQPVAGDVVVVANQLGVRGRPDGDRLARGGLVLIDDHSHDLGSGWAWDTHADYAIASLRKTLPIPDGGVVWSPRGLDLPPEPAAPGGSGAAERLACAIARRGERAGTVRGERLQLLALARTAAGPAAPASTPRKLGRVAANSDRAGGSIASLPPGAPARAGISPVSRALLGQMPARAWRERRRANLETLMNGVGTAAGWRVLTAPEDGVAFRLTLVFDTEAARERVREALTARAVATAVLWPLDPAHDPGIHDADADLSRRILSVNADQRFNERDMTVLARILGEALRSA